MLGRTLSRLGTLRLYVALILVMVSLVPRVEAAASKSLSEWVTCGSSADQTSAVMSAFAAAKNAAFTLVVDCPVYLDSDLAVDRGIFIDNGTTVQFTGSGKFFVNNMFHPAFVIANSSNILLINWNVEWDGSVPISGDFGGYYLNGQWVAEAGLTQPAEGFNDYVLTPWLAQNRGIDFDGSQGWIKSIWVGGVNPAAVFFITGDSGNITIGGLNLYVPSTAAGSSFMPMAISASANWKSNQSVTTLTPETVQYAAVPHQLTFKNIHLDGTLMGWQGNLQDATFTHVTSNRYADLQDSNGANVGGIGKWFPPPHLFYLNTQAADPGLNNINVDFSHINDQGNRIGVARDKGGGDTTSGYANSLKLSCTTCSVQNYISRRPDGFMDVLPSDGLTLSLVYASFNSQFLNNLYPPGIRFPSTGYTNVAFNLVTFTDTAATTVAAPIGNAANASNNGISFVNLQANLKNWSGTNSVPVPTISGSSNNIMLNYAMAGQLTNVMYRQVGSLGMTVTNSPDTVNPGAATSLNWGSTDASSCTAGGAWSGSIGTGGTRLVTLAAAGKYTFTLTCQNSSSSASATLYSIAN